ncbi:septin-5-like isoform X1 [Arapaima gigas]
MQLRHSTVEITKYTVDIEEKGVKLRLTVVDTPGFGDAVNNTQCWRTVTDYIDLLFEQYLRDESSLNHKNIQDNCVRCCLYFISPFGHGYERDLRPVDVEFVKSVHDKVNVVPVLAKADSLTPPEIQDRKARIRGEMERHGMKIYRLPDCDLDEDVRQQDQQLRDSGPFAVVGSDCVMEDLKDVTRETQYEKCRVRCIQSMMWLAQREMQADAGQWHRCPRPPSFSIHGQRY